MESLFREISTATFKLLKSNEMISPKLEKYNSDIELYYKFINELL